MARAFIDASRSIAATWYNVVRLETRGGHAGGANIPVGTVHLVSNINFLGLLNSINEHAQPGETIVIVCHGNPEGFSFPLVPGTGVYPNVQSLTDLMSDAEIQIPDVSAEQVAQLRAAMTGIRSKNLIGVEIRACNLGGGSNLPVFRRFFGSQYVAAPIVTDFFHEVPGINRRSRSQLQELLSRPNYRCYSPPRSAASGPLPPGGAPPIEPDLCLYFQHAGGSSYSIGVYTVDDPAPRIRWMQSSFAAENAFHPPQSWLTGAFVVHGVVLASQLVFPAEIGYRNNILVDPPAVG